MNVALVFLAAGASTRFKSDKLFTQVVDRPLIVQSLSVYMNDDRVNNIVIVYKDGDKQKIENLISQYYPEHSKNIFYTLGGEARSQSTKAALMLIKEKIDCEFVAITDSARCWTSNAVLDRLFLSLENDDFSNAIPAVRRSETFKIIQKGVIEKTLKNNYLYEIQTPQIFKKSRIIEAYEKGFDKKKWAVDDGDVYFNYFKNEKVNIVEGDVRNIKVTFPGDIRSFYETKGF